MLAPPRRGLSEIFIASDPHEEYTAEEVTEMVDAAWDEQEIETRGAITPSHMEAIVGLPEEE